MNVIGLMSGTSVDGIDAALVQITGFDLDLEVKLWAGATYPYPDDLRGQILSVAEGNALSIAELAELDDAIAVQFAQAAQAIQAGQPAPELIGSHGQTLYHRPSEPQAGGFPLGYSLQLGRGAAIAALTGISTVSNFRVADIALGGQGAPLVSRIDAALLSHPTAHRCIQNLGGIGNLTYLPARQQSASTADWLAQITGWDTGPGNILLDLAVQHFSQGQQRYDQGGQWASQGSPCLPLVEQWLAQPFFQQPPPKSTGREQFGAAYLHHCLQDAESYQLDAADLLATLTELTVRSIVQSYQTHLPQLPREVILCGGGSQNLYLIQRLKTHLEPAVSVLTTDEVGLSADYKEAIAFAVLAYWSKQGVPGNLPQVTGASRAVVLGDCWHP